MSQFRISWISCKLFRYFIKWREFPSIPTLLSVFVMNRYWISLSDFSEFIEINHTVLVLYFASDFLLTIANFFKIFVFIRDIGLYISYKVFIRFCFLNCAGLIKWVKKYPPFILPVKELYKIRTFSSLNFWKNLPVKSVGTEVFVKWLFFNDRFYFLKTWEYSDIVFFIWTFDKFIFSKKFLHFI